MRVIGLVVVLALSIALAPLAVEAQPDWEGGQRWLSVGRLDLRPETHRADGCLSVGAGRPRLCEGRSISIESRFSGDN